jgi:cytochrome P450
MRRSALAPYFSKQRIREVEPIIRRKVALLKSKMLERAETGEILNLQRVYAALSLDVISQHTLGESWEALERPDLGGGIVDSIQGLLHLHPWGRAFPFIVRNLEGAVSWILSFQDGGQDYGSSLQGYFRYQKDTVAKVVARAKDQEKPGASADAPLLEKVVRESALPDQEKTVYRMSAETNVLISAGTDTTARPIFSSSLVQMFTLGSWQNSEVSCLHLELLFRRGQSWNVCLFCQGWSLSLSAYRTVSHHASIAWLLTRICNTASA